MERKLMYLVATVVAMLFYVEGMAQGVATDSATVVKSTNVIKPTDKKPSVVPYDNPNRTTAPKPRDGQQQDGKKERVPPAGVPTFQTVPAGTSPKNGGAAMINSGPAMRYHDIETAIC